MAGTPKRVGPLALTTTLTTNVYVPPSSLIGEILRHIHIANKTGTAATFTLYLGATGANAAGTELWVAKNVAANDAFDFYCAIELLSTDFLVGGSGTATALTITMALDQYVL